MIFLAKERTVCFLILVWLMVLSPLLPMAQTAHQGIALGRGAAVLGVSLISDETTALQAKKRIIATDLIRLITALMSGINKKYDKYSLCWALYDLHMLVQHSKLSAETLYQQQLVANSKSALVLWAHLFETLGSFCAAGQELSRNDQIKKYTFFQGLVSLARLFEKYVQQKNDKNKKLFICALAAHAMLVLSELRVTADDLVPLRVDRNEGFFADMAHEFNALSYRAKRLVPDTFSWLRENASNLWHGRIDGALLAETAGARIHRFSAAQPRVHLTPTGELCVTRQDEQGQEETVTVHTERLEPGDPFVLPVCNHLLNSRLSEASLRACPICFYPRNDGYLFGNTLENNAGDRLFTPILSPVNNWWGRVPEQSVGEASIFLQPYTEEVIEQLAQERGEVQPPDFSLVV